MHYVSCQMYERGLVTIQAIQNEQPTPIFIMVLLKMSGWVHVFAIKMLSIILPLKSNPWKIISHVNTFKKAQDYKLIRFLIVIQRGTVAAMYKYSKWLYDFHAQICCGFREFMLDRDLWAVKAKRMDPDGQQATSYKRFNSINTQPIVLDCLTIDFVNTTCGKLMWQRELRENEP